MKAQVAYENAREAKRKLKAVKPLRWHRLEAEGRYEAKGARGRYVLVSRSPDRRKGIFPWTVFSGGLKGPELKAGGFDLKAEAALFAAQYDAGLCGAPAVVVQAPSPEGLPPGVYRGTAAGEGGIGTLGGSDYAWQVVEALSAMGVQAPREMVASSEIYVGQMEAAHIEPATVAAVLVATKDHRHVHDCPEKHVDLAEGGAAENQWHTWRVDYLDKQGKVRNVTVGADSKEYAYELAKQVIDLESIQGGWGWERRAGIKAHKLGSIANEGARESARSEWEPDDHIFRGMRYQVWREQDGWVYRVQGKHRVGPFPDRYQADAAARRALGEAAGFSMAVEAREGRPYAQGWHVMYLPPGEHRSKKEWFETEGEAKARLRELRASGVKGGIVESISEFEGTNEAAAREDSRAFKQARSDLAAIGYSIQSTGWGDYRVVKKGERDPDAGYFTADLDDAVATGRQMASGMSANEAKKRLPQPDPGSGYWITHSSLTRNLFLMKGDRLVGQYDKREDALKAAADLSSSAEETRRPKGRRHR